jgi:hypothetical protein
MEDSLRILTWPIFQIPGACSSPEFGSIESAFADLAGEYGNKKQHIEDDRFSFTGNQGEIFKLLPLEEDRFMAPSRYALQIHM